jgi:hypothetical protein
MFIWSPPFLFPPRGKGLNTTPSPVGEGWEGGNKTQNGFYYLGICA